MRQFLFMLYFIALLLPISSCNSTEHKKTFSASEIKEAVEKSQEMSEETNRIFRNMERKNTLEERQRVQQEEDKKIKARIQRYREERRRAQEEKEKKLKSEEKLKGLK